MPSLFGTAYTWGRYTGDVNGSGADNGERNNTGGRAVQPADNMTMSADKQKRRGTELAPAPITHGMEP